MISVSNNRLLMGASTGSVVVGTNPNPNPTLTLSRRAAQPSFSGLKVVFFSITGLFLSERPRIELWDASGLQFSSESPTHIADSTWSSQFGSGFFKIDASLFGDFSIICRLGGASAGGRGETTGGGSSVGAAADKATLLFKYQDNTLFLGTRVELNKSNVDFNPDILKGINVDDFKMNLELSSISNFLQNTENDQTAARRERQSLLPARSGRGKKKKQEK